MKSGSKTIAVWASCAQPPLRRAHATSEVSSALIPYTVKPLQINAEKYQGALEMAIVVRRSRASAVATGAAHVAPIRARLPLDPEEFRRRPPENLDSVLVAEPGNRHDVVDGGSVPRERVIGPEDHVIDPRLGDQVPHALAREHDRIEIQLAASEIFGRLFLRQGPDPVREGRDHRVRAVGIGRQETAAMRGADLEAWEAVERPFKNQMRQGNRGFERVADRVRQQTSAGQPAARFQFAGAERVQEDEHPQRFARGPEGVEFRVGEIRASDTAGHTDAAE